MTLITQKVIIHRIGSSCLGSNNFRYHMHTILDYYTDFCNIVVVSALPTITDKLIAVTCAKTITDRNTLIEGIKISYKKMAVSILPKELVEEYEAFLVRNFPYLYKLARKNPPPYEELIFQGEVLSTELVRLFFNSCSKKAITLDAENLIRVQEENGAINPDLITCSYQIQHLSSMLKNNKTIYLVPGFYGIDRNQKIVLLGRNGSDITAAILGYGLINDFEVEILFWKDVDGLFTADPKVARNVRFVAELSHKEFLQYYKKNSGLIHPKTVEIAALRNITLKIKNFENPLSPIETIIQSEFQLDQKHWNRSKSKQLI